MNLQFLDTVGLVLAQSEPSRLDALARLGGRLHVVVVHFPIALLIVAGLFEFLRSRKADKKPSTTALRCLVVGTIAAAIAAGMGWLNADREITGIPSAVVTWHRWLGVAAAAVALLACLAAWPASRRPDSGAFLAFRLILLAAAGLVGVAGHFGGRLTHGDDYLTDALAAVLGDSQPPPALAPPPANPDTLEARAISILEHSCTECHGRAKTKGGLSLTKRESALRGGKNGPAITPGQPELGELVHRLTTDDPDLRMPSDADPLPDEQIRTLEEWIKAGAKWPDGASPAAKAP